MVQTATRTRQRLGRLGPLMVGFVGIQLFVNMANGGVGGLLIPNRIAIADPEQKVVLLGIAAAASAVVALVAQPVWGMLSDRTRSRTGRRMPWVLAGILGVVASIVLLSAVEDFVLMLVLMGVFSAFYGMVQAPITAIVPDRTPVARRGLFSGLAGIGIFVGGILGTVVASGFVRDLPAGFLVLAAIVLLGALPLVLTLREDASQLPTTPQTSLRATLRAFLVSPREHPDFAWAFVARLVMVMGFQSILTFQLYILADHVGLGLVEANAVYPVATLIVTGCIVVALIPAGLLSEWLGRRKVIVVVAAIIMAASTVPPLLDPTVPTALASLAVSGVGIGIFLAVDQALMTQVLPSATSAGKDLGLLNIAQAGGQALAPVAASIVITAAGYPGLYVFAGVLAILSALAVLPIRSVR